MEKKIIFSLLFIFSIMFAANSEVIRFNNNWGKHHLFNVISEKENGLEIIFSIHQMVIEEHEIDGIPMKTFGIPGIFLPNDEGAPNLAGTGRYIAIPQGAQAKATIVSARTEVYKNVEVAPAPKIPLDNDDSPLRCVKNIDIYSKDAYYPESPVKLSEPLQIRGVDCVILGITPFQYNPVTKELIVYKDLRVRVDFIGGNGHFGDDALRNIYWEPVLQGNLLNYNSLPKIDFFAPERIHARDGYEYIIIVPDDPVFIAWAETIKIWRQLQGISTNVYTITQVGGNTTTAIKNFLSNAYNTWNPRPVGFLLLSDYESSGKVYGITSYRQTHPYSGTYVSDVWYADMNGDNLPDMFHGRICAQNDDQLRVMITKFLNHERTPPTAAIFYNEPIVACGWQTERWFQLCAEVIRGFFINGLGKNPHREYNIYSGTPTAGGAWSTATNTSTVVNYFYNLGWLPSTTNPNGSAWWNNGSSQGIANGINSGAFILQHRDHGSETGWGEPQFTNTHINLLTNDKLVFVNSHNCLTGRFDWSSECFTEKFHRYTYNNVPSGALAVNAASQVSYSFVNDCYAWGMYDGLWPQFMPDYPAQEITPITLLYPCAAMNYGKYFLASSSWPYNTSDKLVTYYLFHHHGDVFNPLYSEVPQNLTVNHPAMLIAGSSTFTISANDSAIIALTINGEIIGAAMATGSWQIITIPPQLPGTNMIVTVTKQNYFRYQATVPVVASGYPYVVATSPVVNDSNANGQVNPNELINYGIWAKNIGVGTAQNISGKINCSDSLVTILIDSSWFGNIPANDSLYSNPAYRFRTNVNTPNNYQLNFNITFKDANDSIFISNQSIRVYRPILNFQNVAVMGGNNNGIFNRGETVNIVVTIKNIGGANAQNVSANLLVNHPNITLLDGQGSFAMIAPNSTANNASDPFTVCADTLITPGTIIQFRVALNYDYWSDTFNFSLPVEIYLEDFENSNGGYLAIPSSGGWEWGIPTSGPNNAHSGSKLWATNLVGTYANSANWKLISPEFIATADNPQLKFWHWYSTESRYDGGNLKISTDDQVTWRLIHPIGGYPDTAYASNVAIPRESCFTGSTSGQVWSEVIFNLPVQAGQRFYLYWHFGSDPAVNSYPGWYLDDISGIGFAYALPLQNDVGVRAIISPGQYHFVNSQLYPKAWIKNYGLTNQNNIPVVCSIFGAGNILRYYLTANILSLPANDSILLTFQTWTPTDIETCRVVINTFLNNDENPLNNRKTRLTYVANAIDIIIGNGTSSSSMYPIYNYYTYSVTEALYRQEEINFYGYISKLAYYKSSGAAIYPIENVQIYMKLTTETSLASGSYDTTGYTLVYNGSFTNNATSGWMEIELDVPFLYDNSYNLKILVIKGPPAVTSGYPSWRYTSTSPTYCNRYGYGSSLPTTLSQTYSRPDVRFTFTSAGQAQFDVGVHSIISPPTRHLVNTVMIPTARIKNYGTLTQINIPVVCSIYGRNGVVRYTASDIVPLLNSNQIITVNFNSYTPTNVETCLVVFRTLLANDSNPTNDSRSINTIITNSLEIIIGTGTSGSSLYFLYGYNNYAASEAIYLQNEIAYPGYITNIAYYKTAGSNTTQFDNVRIYMKHTQASTIATGAFDTTDYTLVYQGILPFYAIGWMDVQLTTPFLYNNTDNLQILALKGPPAISSGYPSWQYTSLSPNYRNRYGYSNSSWPTSLSQSYYRPNVRLTLSSSAPGITQNQLTLPTITMLNNVKPNPIQNNHIHISYTIAQRTHVLLNIYDASGRLIKTLVNGDQDQGTYDCIWTTIDQNNQAVKSGIYFYTLQTDNYRETKKLIISR